MHLVVNDFVSSIVALISPSAIDTSYELFDRAESCPGVPPEMLDRSLLFSFSPVQPHNEIDIDNAVITEMIVVFFSLYFPPNDMYDC